MKAKILLISTRWIHEPKSIFSKAERCNPNSALKEYFSIASNNELRKLLAAKQEVQSQQKVAIIPSEGELVPLNKEQAKEIRGLLTEQLKKDEKLSKLYTDQNYSEFVQTIYDKIEAYLKKEEYKDQIEAYNVIKEKIRPYLSNKQDCVKNEELPPFVFSDKQDDFIECSDCNAINIDKDTSTGCTLADRISLYKVMEEKYEDKESNEQILFMVYAVWPLGNSNKDKSNDKEQDSVKWIDQLAKAIKEECKGNEDLKDNEDIELILLLHDNDMLSTSKKPLKTVEIDFIIPKEIAEGIKRTVAVYQHSNNKFITLATQENQESAKKIFDDARKFIVEDLIFQQLARLSGFLASYSGSETNEEIKSKIDWLKRYIKEEHDPHGYLKGLDNLYISCLDNSLLSSQCLICSNQSVNNLIKEIVIPENYR